MREMQAALRLWQKKEFTGMKPGLERIRRFLEKDGNPQRAFKVVHVAGTNGKGSVSKLISSGLTASGYKTGLYISPHLVSMSERIQIDAKPIAEKELYRLASLAYSRAKRFKLTFFEFITAIALIYFREQGVDVAVLETGLGGRFDATNVFEEPLVSVITEISFDHKEILGNSLEKIAKEKAGIIKENCPVILAPQGPGARSIIKREACRKKARLLEYGKDFESKLKKIDWNKKFQQLIYKSRHIRDSFSISLLGAHQTKNAALALAALETVSGRGFPVNFDRVKAALKKASWPGRFDVRKIGAGAKKKILILDGAHNPSAVEALVGTLRKSPWNKERKALIFAVMKDKNYSQIIKVLSPLFKSVTLIELNLRRAMSTNALASIWSKYLDRKHIAVSSSVGKAIRAIKEKVIVATGSLYLVGKILKRRK